MTESRYENGRSVEPWKLTTWPVAGGWAVVWARWIYDPRQGWDEEDRPSDDATVYTTEDEAKAALAFLVRYGKGRAVG